MPFALTPHRRTLLVNTFSMSLGLTLAVLAGEALLKALGRLEKKNGGALKQPTACQRPRERTSTACGPAMW